MLHDEVDQVFDPLAGSVVLGPKLQIFGSIVVPYAILVVDRLLLKEGPADSLRHDKSMNVGETIRVCHWVMLPNLNPGVATWRGCYFVLSPRKIVSAMPVKPSSTPGAIPTVECSSVAVWIDARDWDGGSPLGWLALG